jgi:hypothetical protein
MPRFLENVMEKICECFFLFYFIYKLYETVLILLRFEQDIIKTAQTSSRKLPVILITL